MISQEIDFGAPSGQTWTQLSTAIDPSVAPLDNVEKAEEAAEDPNTVIDEIIASGGEPTGQSLKRLPNLIYFKYLFLIQRNNLSPCIGFDLHQLAAFSCGSIWL